MKNKLQKHKLTPIQENFCNGVRGYSLTSVQEFRIDQLKNLIKKADSIGIKNLSHAQAMRLFNLGSVFDFVNRKPTNKERIEFYKRFSTFNNNKVFAKN